MNSTTTKVVSRSTSLANANAKSKEKAKAAYEQKKNDQNNLLGCILRMLITTTIWIVSFILRLILIPTIQWEFFKAISNFFSSSTKKLAIAELVKNNSAIKFYQNSSATTFGQVINIILIILCFVSFLVLLFFQAKYMYDILNYSLLYFAKYNKSNSSKKLKKTVYNNCLKKKLFGKRLSWIEKNFCVTFFKNDKYLKNVEIIHKKSLRYLKHHYK